MENTPVSQTWWDPHSTGKISPKFVPGERKTLKPHWIFWIENNENKYPQLYKIKGILIPSGIFVLNFIPAGYEISTGSVRQGCWKCLRFFCLHHYLYLFFYTYAVNTNEIKTLSMKELASHVPEFYLSNLGNFTCEGFVSSNSKIIHNTPVSCTCRWDSSKILPW